MDMDTELRYMNVIIGEFYSRKPGVNSVLLFSLALIETVFCNNNTRF